MTETDDATTIEHPAVDELPPSAPSVQAVTEGPPSSVP